jgi:NAD-dependent deacetylase
MKAAPNPNKIVVFSGSGLSSASGIPTFRDSHGLWQQYDVMQLASPTGFAQNPQLVHQFYQERRLRAHAASPNAAHLAIAKLEQQFEVVVVTQNVDDLHERAGSSQVIHLHGKLNELRHCRDASKVFAVGDTVFDEHSLAPDGSPWQPQLWRPNIVWFNELVPNMDQAASHFREAGKVMVVGTSLVVEPAASLIYHCRQRADKYFFDVRQEHCPIGFYLWQGEAVEQVPRLVESWLGAGAQRSS